MSKLKKLEDMLTNGKISRREFLAREKGIGVKSSFLTYTAR